MGSSPVQIDKLTLNYADNSIDRADGITLIIIAEVSYQIDQKGNRRTELFSSLGNFSTTLKRSDIATKFRVIARNELRALEQHLMKFHIDTTTPIETARGRIGPLTFGLLEAIDLWNIKDAG